MQLFMFRPQDCDHNLNYILYQYRFKTKPKRMQPLIRVLHHSLDKNIQTETDFERQEMLGRDLSTLKRRREEIQKNIEEDWSISKQSDSRYSESNLQRELDEIIRQKQIQKMTEKIMLNKNHRKVIEPDIFGSNQESQIELPLSYHEEGSQKEQIKINKFGSNFPNFVIRGNLFDQDGNSNQNDFEQIQDQKGIHNFQNRDQLDERKLNKFDKQSQDNTKSELRQKVNQLDENGDIQQNQKQIKAKFVFMKEMEQKKSKQVQNQQREEFRAFILKQTNQEYNNKQVNDQREETYSDQQQITQKLLQYKFKDLLEQSNELSNISNRQVQKGLNINRQICEGKQSIQNDKKEQIYNFFRNLEEQNSTRRTGQQTNQVQQTNQNKTYSKHHNNLLSRVQKQQIGFTDLPKDQAQSNTYKNSQEIQGNQLFQGNKKGKERRKVHIEQNQNTCYKTKYKSMQANKRKNSSELSKSRKNSTKKQEEETFGANNDDEVKWNYSNSLGFTQNPKLANFSNRKSQYPSFQKSLQLFQYSKQFDKMLEKPEKIRKQEINKVETNIFLAQHLRAAKLQTNVSPNEKDEHSENNNEKKKLQQQKIGLFANKQREGVSYKRNFKYQKEQQSRSFLKKPNNKINLFQVHKSIQKYNNNEKARVEMQKKQDNENKLKNEKIQNTVSRNQNIQIQINKEDQKSYINTNEITSHENNISQMARRTNSLNDKLQNKYDSLNNNQYAQSLVNVGSVDPNYQTIHQTKSTSNIKYKSISAIKSEGDYTLLKLMGGSDHLKQISSFAFQSKPPSELFRQQNYQILKTSFGHQDINNKQSNNSNFSLTQPEIASLYSSTFRLERNNETDFNLEDALKQQIKKYNSFKQLMEMTPINSNNHSKDYVENLSDQIPPLFEQNDEQEYQYDPKFTSYKKFGDYKPERQLQMAVIEELESNKVMSSNTSKVLVVFESIQDYQSHFHPREKALLRFKAQKGGSLEGRINVKNQHKNSLSLSPMKRLGCQMGSLQRLKNRKQKNLGRFKTRLNNY